VGLDGVISFGRHLLSSARFSSSGVMLVPNGQVDLVRTS
jgi:hypothetical protein